MQRMLSVDVAPEESDDAVDTVKSGTQRADVYGVSDGHGGYQVNDPSAGVPFLPRLPEPAPRVAPVTPSPDMLAGMSAAAAEAAVPQGSVATMERSVAAPPEAPLPVAPVDQRPPRRTFTESIRLFISALPVIVLAVAFGGGTLVSVNETLGPATIGASKPTPGGNGSGSTDNGGDSELPRYSAAAPTFGTATYHTTVEGGYDARVTFNADGSQVWFEFFPWSTETADSTILANPGATFVRTPAAGWVLVDVQGSSQLAPDLTAVRMTTFAEFVPEALRPYVRVEAHRSLVLSGRTVDEYALYFDVSAMQAAHPGLTSDWLYRLGMVPGATYTQLTLSLDAQGVVWKAVSVDPLGPDVAWTLEYLGPEPFTVQFPTTYYNAVTGQQVNG